MPSLRHKLPEYTRYKGRFARVQINGKSVHLGRYGTAASMDKYKRVIAAAAARDLATTPDGKPVVLVASLVKPFVEHINRIFRKPSGRKTGTAENYRPVLRLLVEKFGLTPAEEFGPLAFKALRLALVDRGLCRRSVNEAAAKVKALFQFACGEELVSERVFHRLATVKNLRAGETSAPESVRVEPVDDAVIEATLPHLPPIVGDMVRLQRLTGARPGEIVQLRPQDLDRSGEIWSYKPREHKTEAHGITRVICIGPQAQAILLPYLLRPADQVCFSPREVWKGRSWIEGARREPKAAYTSDTYRRSIARGCEKAFGMPAELRRAPTATGKRKAVETPEAKQARQAAAEAWRAKHCWHPHQLRHTAATEIRKTFGLEAAQVTLGHTKANMTERYAEKNMLLAEEVARRIG